jgi:hypothetical protein
MTKAEIVAAIRVSLEYLNNAKGSLEEQERIARKNCDIFGVEEELEQLVLGIKELEELIEELKTMAVNEQQDFGPGYSQGQGVRLTFEQWEKMKELENTTPLLTRNQYLQEKERKIKAEATYTRINDGAKFDNVGRMIGTPLVDTSARDAVEYHGDEAEKKAYPNIQDMVSILEKEIFSIQDVVDELYQKLETVIVPVPDEGGATLVPDGVEEMCISNTGARLRYLRSMLQSVNNKLQNLVNSADV